MDRLQLQSLLEGLLGSGNVYFQPPNNVAMNYPAIVYHWNDERTEFADNNPYNHARKYQVTIIDRNPDSDIPSKISALPMSLFNRTFRADNLNHFVYNLYI